MKQILTRLSSSDFEKLKEYADSKGISIYSAAKELILQGLRKTEFEFQLLEVIRAYVRFNHEFKVKLEKLLLELEEL